jgi:hypothetical protein
VLINALFVQVDLTIPVWRTNQNEQARCPRMHHLQRRRTMHHSTDDDVLEKLS